MNGFSDQEFMFFADPLRHQDGLGDAGGTVIKRCVGDFHSRELSDVCLKLKYRLQGSLGNLGLIWSVRGIKLRTGNQSIDDDRYVVPIDARADEGRLAAGILGGSGLTIVDKFWFRKRLDKIQESFESEQFSNAGQH